MTPFSYIRPVRDRFIVAVGVLRPVSTSQLACSISPDVDDRRRLLAAGPSNDGDHGFHERDRRRNDVS